MLTLEPSIYSANAFMSARLDEFVEVRQRLLEERARIESEGDAYVRQLVDKMGGRFDSLVSYFLFYRLREKNSKQNL